MKRWTERRKAQLKYAICILGSRLESSLPQDKSSLASALQKRCKAYLPVCAIFADAVCHWHAVVADGAAQRTVSAAELITRLYSKVTRPWQQVLWTRLSSRRIASLAQA